MSSAEEDEPFDTNPSDSSSAANLGTTGVILAAESSFTFLATANVSTLSENETNRFKTTQLSK